MLSKFIYKVQLNFADSTTFNQFCWVHFLKEKKKASTIEWLCY